MFPPSPRSEAVLENTDNNNNSGNTESNSIEGPLNKIAHEFDTELLKLAEEVQQVAEVQQNLSEQMLELRASVLHVREKHRCLTLMNDL